MFPNIFFEMRLGIITWFLVLGFNGTAQGVISFPEYNVLYKGYDNVLVIGAEQRIESLVLEGNGLSITKSNDSCFILRVSGTGRTAQINVKNKLGKSLGTWQFRVMNFPQPVLHWGIYSDGSEVSLDQLTIRADYGEKALWGDVDLEIKSYEINSDLFEKPLKISKGLITQEVIEALEKAKVSNEGKPVAFDLNAIVRGKDRILRRVRASFVY